MSIVVDLLETGDDFKQSLVARLFFDGKKISVAQGKKNILHVLNEDGVVGKDQMVYRPKDGEKFMRALPWQFDGTRLRATLQETQKK